jgi:hypothetical protein
LNLFPETFVFQKKYLWFFYVLFALSSALLGYFQLSRWEQWGILTLGLLLPWALGFKYYGHEFSLSKPVFEREFLDFEPLWILPILWAAAVFLRFYHLTSLSLWPLTDEAKSGYFSILWADHPQARLLYDFSQLPPLYIWMQGFLFKAAGASLFSLWFLPAVLSSLTVLVSYWAARFFVSKTFSLIFTALMAFSFWPLYEGRFSHPGTLLLLWEFLAVGILGLLIRSPGEKFSRTGAFGLGLWVGLGFYTFTSWISVAFFLTLCVLYWARVKSRPLWVGLFFLGALLGYLPLGWAEIHQGYGGYIQQVFAFHPGYSILLQCFRGLSDVAAIFWKSIIPSNLFAYRPFWGGYLNPLLGGLFFIGLLDLCRSRSHRGVVLLALAGFLFYLPGFLTGGVEMFRILPLLPVLLSVVTVGGMTLLSTIKVSLRPLGLAALLLFSFLLDGHHLFGVYGSLWTHPQDNWFASKSAERLRAFGLLEELQKKAGPGLILSQLVPDLYDQSLSVASWRFNPEINQTLDISRASWAAILINIHYQPLLAKTFPQGRGIWLSSDLGEADGGLMLFILPLNPSNLKEINRYYKADTAMGSLIGVSLDNRDYRSRGPVLEGLFHLYPLFQGDRFLESCFWEKIAENEYGDRAYDAQVRALQKALELGYPAAHLYNNLGSLYLRRSRWEEARECFEKALHCQPNDTSAFRGLKILDNAEQTGKLPSD